MDLFEQRAQEVAQASRPLAERLRPTNLEEFEGQKHAVGKGSLENQQQECKENNRPAQAVRQHAVEALRQQGDAVGLPVYIALNDRLKPVEELHGFYNLNLKRLKMVRLKYLPD